MQSWITNTTTTSTGASYMPLVTTTGSSVMTWPAPDCYWPAQPAAPQTPLEWLDGEVEKTCALARQS